MDKNLIIDDLNQKHQAFGQYIDSLSKAEFELSHNAKWSAGQELDHILKGLLPLSTILHKKALMISKFGLAELPSADYDVLVKRYQNQLAEGGQAFGQFLPENVNWDQKKEMLQQLHLLTNRIGELILQFSEEELDQLRLPHPLLGLLTLREMFYFTNYHVEHHQNNISRNLNMFKSSN